MAKGTREAIQEQGLLGVFTGGVTAGAAGIAAAVFFGYLAAIFSNPEIRANRYVRYGKFAYRGLRILQGRVIGMLLYKLMKHIYEKDAPRHRALARIPEKAQK